MPRYLVWHPLDHIFYRIVKPAGATTADGGTRVHIREAFQRDPQKLLDVTVTVERVDTNAAIIGDRILGLSALRLVNKFQPVPNGTSYTTELTIGDAGPIGHLGFNYLMGRILPGAQADAWIRHHIEEIGNLENFLPELWSSENTLNPEETPTWSPTGKLTSERL